MNSLLDLAVHSAPRLEQESVLATITAAFLDDPVARWVWSDDRDHATWFPEFAAAFGGRAFAYGTADVVARAQGAALWLPPAVTPDERALEDVVQRAVPAERQADLAALMDQMGAFHPAGPHWYLPLIGVAPQCQGRGVGAALLRHALARCDTERLPAYLESSNPRNLSLYRRHGFEVVGTIQAGGSPVMYPMVRPARSV